MQRSDECLDWVIPHRRVHEALLNQAQVRGAERHVFGEHLESTYQNERWRRADSGVLPGKSYGVTGGFVPVAEISLPNACCASEAAFHTYCTLLNRVLALSAYQNAVIRIVLQQIAGAQRDSRHREWSDTRKSLYSDFNHR